MDRVRNRIAPLKCNSDNWLKVMEIAHELGLKSSATMMFGHVETLDDRLEHLQRLRDQQDATGGLHGLHLLDLPARAHEVAGGAGHLGGVSAHAGAVADFPG